MIYIFIEPGYISRTATQQRRECASAFPILSLVTPISAHSLSFFVQTMTTRVTSNDLFPLLELPDDVLDNVLQRCPPGSIAGFPLPLALAQVRLTGSVDPYWLRPLLHLASKYPAVLDRLTPHLRSIELLEAQSTSSMIAIAPFLTRLERLSIDQKVSTATLAALPTCLTKLSVRGVILKGGSLEDLSSSLLRLTALEELDLGDFPEMADWTVGGSLPRLRRLKYSWGMLPRDLGTFAPNLEALEAELATVDLERLPITLTELRFAGSWSSNDSLLPLTRLTGLKDLGLTPYMNIPEELPELLGSLTALTRLEIQDQWTDRRMHQLLEKGHEGLCIFLDWFSLHASSSAVERLFGHLVEVKFLLVDNPASLPWAALTRLTRLGLNVDGRKDASWIQPLSQLPSLRDLEVMLRGQVPEGFGSLTQCTKLLLWNIRSTANLCCLQHLTRLREGSLEKSPVECLAALPDCLTKLRVYCMKKSPDLPLGQALQHLTALKDLEITWPEGKGRAFDLSSLKRLTSLALTNVSCPLIRLGCLPCLRSLDLSSCHGIDGALLRQLGRKAPSLRELLLGVFWTGDLPTDANLAPLTRLSLLEELVLPRDLGRVTPGGIRRLLDHLPLLDTLKAKSGKGDLLQDPAWAELKQQAGDRLHL